MTLDLEQSRLDGLLEFRYPNTSQETLPSIVFRLYPNLPQFGGQMEIDRLAVDGVSVDPEYSVSETVLEVALPTPLEPGQIARINMSYVLRYPRLESDYVLFGEHEGLLSLPYAYPMLAVRDHQGWHRYVPPAFPTRQAVIHRSTGSP